MRLIDLLRSIESRLKANPWLDQRGTIPAEAETLLLHACVQAKVPSVRSRLDLHSQPMIELPGIVEAEALAFARHRAEGFPLQYLTRTQPFLEHNYDVRPGVLIPRPETELLVRALSNRLSPAARVGWEVGVGSGVISIELLFAHSSLSLWGSDLSSIALAVAKENSEKILGATSSRLTLVSSLSPTEILEPFKRVSAPAPDFIVSNPPYLVHPQDEVEPDVREHEPHEALFAPDADPLFFYRRLALDTKIYRKGAFILACEIPHERASSIESLFQSEGWAVSLEHDLTDRPRVLLAHERNPQHG